LASLKNCALATQSTSFLKKNKISNFLMKIFSHITKLLFILSLFVLGGCFTASPDDDRMPQGRPASWEYSLPGGFDRGGFNR
jgi:hypothetical protein